MQKIAMPLLLFLVSHAFAQTSPPVYGGYVYTATPPNLAEKCISDICGPPPQSNLYMTKYLDRLTDYMRLSSDPKQIDFPPSTSKFFSDLAAETDKENEAVLAVFKKSKDMGNAQPVGISKALYNVMYASPFLKKIKYKTSMVGGKMITTVDEAASKAELKDLSLEDRNWILRVGKYSAAQSSSGSLSDNEVQSQPADLLLKMLHPSDSVSVAMKAELSEAQMSLTSLKNLSPLERAVFFNKTSPDRIALIATHVAQGTVDENETREIIQWNRTYKNTNSLFRNPNSPLMTRSTPSMEEIIKKAGGIDTISQVFSQDRTQNRQKDISKIESCKMQYFLNKGLLPSKDQVDTLRQDIARSKQMVKNMVKARFPPPMQQKILKAVDKADFVTPPTATDFEKSFNDSIRQKLEAERNNSAALNNISPQDIRQLISVFSLLKSAQDTNENDTSNEYCDAFKSSPMSDGNYTTYGSIVLSFTTATGDEPSRLKTIMHELGHSVSKAIADDPLYSNQFSSVRTCLADQHTEEFPPQTKKAYDEAKAANPKANGPYVEEDFADTVAGISGREIKGRNLWCQFMTLTYDRQQYQESNMKADDGDPHSASLFRLLNFEMMKSGSVTDSCLSFYKAAQYTQHFNSCFDLANLHSSNPAQPARAVK